MIPWDVRVSIATALIRRVFGPGDTAGSAQTRQLQQKVVEIARAWHTAVGAITTTIVVSAPIAPVSTVALFPAIVHDVTSSFVGILLVAAPFPTSSVLALKIYPA